MREAEAPQAIEEVFTEGHKFRYRAKFPKAPLRKSKWSAYKDYLKSEGLDQ